MLVFAMKNEKNRTFFKEKMQADSHSIRQVFDAEKPDLAIFHAKIDKSVKFSSYFIRILSMFNTPYFKKGKIITHSHRKTHKPFGKSCLFRYNITFIFI
ncbi:Uncharacterised protein [Moraxella lacunata]|uniref:Uncharacterized protein n=2 Tax=Moraxella lacunata TaxID=477 RepID=A0A378QLA4_MORLA|nr:Uncharacterised protein [Moraxella lacunata]